MKNSYSVNNTVVKGNGYSYNLNNKVDALHLCNKLNEYETTCKYNQDYEKLKQQIIALQMDIQTMQATLNKIKELI